MAPSSSRTALVCSRAGSTLFFCIPLLCFLQRTTAWTTTAANGLAKHHTTRRHFLEPSRRPVSTSGNSDYHYGQQRSPLGAAGRGDVVASRRRSQQIRRAGGTTCHVIALAAVPPSGESSSGGYSVEDVGRCRLEALPPLNNKYYALRHGQSVANMEGIISSDPTIGAVNHGLTSNGRAQARAAATALIEVVGRDQLDSLVFVSSEFLRARQTAEECRAALQNIVAFERQAIAGVGGGGGDGGDSEAADAPSVEAEWVDSGETGGYDVCPPVVTRQELRERSFGELDGTILINYNKVWPEDLKDGTQEGYGVESVCDVAARVGRLVRSLEEEYEDASIVFSSHADTLQIAQCHIAGADERLFSQYRFKNGEVRSLLQDPSSLPPPNPLSFQ